ncbi:MAG: alanine--tRNA ligase, partial [Clostridiales bacterium]|nr:alanine--tRNA ligase [Clostridiales bacterium]
FKPYFLGVAVPPKSRIATVQKCVRTSDIERVGETARHLTFFEMLGNFSFGNYFKHEATAWAWEFVTKVMEIPIDRLWVTVYLDDDEAFSIWTKEVGVDPSRIVRLGKADNFWEIGSGPCGPCSEIYYDRGEEYGCHSPNCAVGCDCDRYVEFWNLVFTQFNNDGQGNYTPLEKKNIDTGMGLERLACIMQGVENLFEVDTVRKIMLHISDIAGVRYKENEKKDVSLRVITDHIRSTTMMVCDGVIPSNEGRGYVLRRLLRRAARHGKLLGIERPFLFEVCDTVIHESGDAYPELKQKADYIKKVIQVEEERFDKTIDAGLSILSEMIEKLKKSGSKTMSGEDAFKLYDTFGFPIDLTIEILEEAGIQLDRDTFDNCMNEQKERARSAREKLGDFAWTAADLGIENIPVTKFVGYEKLECKGKILAIIQENQSVESAAGGEVTIITDETPFYAESGGQVADFGTIFSKSAEVEVKNVMKEANGRFFHDAVIKSGLLSVGDDVTLTVDQNRRKAIMRAHSATHLLQKALRNTLGNHVEQAGSLVSPEHVRFDFTHFSAMTSEEIEKVEQEMNLKILEGLSITVDEMPVEEAKKLGAMALFGEKYGKTVRVVRMGDYSIELCGGTHLDNTAKIGLLTILSESSVASGVRRIEAVVGTEVLRQIVHTKKQLQDIAALIKTQPSDVLRRTGQLIEENHEASKKIEQLTRAAFSYQTADMLKNAKDIKDVNVIAVKTEGELSADELRNLADMLKEKDAKLVAVLASVHDGKIQFAAVCGPEAVKKGAHAGNIIREVSKLAGGGGGGRPDSASAGGKDLSKLKDALDAVYIIAEKMIR